MVVGCIHTDSFYGVFPEFCEGIDIEFMAGDDRGEVVLTDNPSEGDL